MAGLYVHIPFCHSKCLYCDFYSTPDRSAVDKVIVALKDEFMRRRQDIEGPYKTVYIGGGTPSILSRQQFASLAAAIPLGDCVEFTIEVNPEDVSAESAALWRDMGVNRVSMGVQSFDDRELKAVGRRLDALTAVKAYDCLRNAGFDNISCDLIYGLPGQSLGSWQKSLGRLVDMEPEHISAYSLTYEDGTALTRLRNQGRIKAADDDLYADMYYHLIDRLDAAGYRHYEISNFARPGMTSRHNSSYWTGEPYLGLGPGAYSFDGMHRIYNSPSIKDYLAGAPEVIEDETDTDIINDAIITALRTDAGLRLDSVAADYRRDIIRSAEKYLNSGDLILDNDCLVIKERSWLIADAIMRDLLV